MSVIELYPAGAHETFCLTELLSTTMFLGLTSAQGKQMIDHAALPVREVEADRNLLREGDPVACCVVLLHGIAYSCKVLEDGKRQILAFHFPGDLCGLMSIGMDPTANLGTDHDIYALTRVKSALVSQSTLLEWIREHGDSRQLIWSSLLLNLTMFRAWVVNVGRRSAYQRTAHLLCELVARLSAANQSLSPSSYRFPFTQAILADALGITQVHVNRMLQRLRGEGLIELGSGVLVVRDQTGLHEAAGLDSNYLERLVPDKGLWRFA